MKIYMRADLEGVTGVVSFQQAEPGKAEYSVGQRMFQSDLNAAIEGCFEGGAARVVIYDMHCDGRNASLDEVDGRAELICGKPRLSPDFIREFDALVLVGFHGKAGAGTLLAHSYEGDTIDIRINGLGVGEIGMEAAIAGECGVPLIMVTGDSEGCREAESLVPGVRTAVVKTSLSPEGALCLPVSQTRELIRAVAAQAVAKAGSVKPFTIAPFKLLEVDLPQPVPVSEERLRAVPGASLHGGTIGIEAPTLFDAWQAYRWLRQAPDALGQGPRTALP